LKKDNSMSFMLSPGVQVTEKDFTSIVPAVSTSAGAFAGVFRWGPVMDPTYIASENELVQKFGSPNDSTFASFFSAANFLAYANNLLVVRVDAAGAKNAVVTKTGGVTSVAKTNAGAGYTNPPTITVGAPDIEGGTQAEVTVTVAGGAIDVVTIVEAGSGYSSAPSLTVVANVADTITTPAVLTAAITAGGVKINNQDDYINNFFTGEGIVGEFAARYPGTLGNNIKVSMADADTYDGWVNEDQFDGPPGADELHIILTDATGAITGTAGGVLETFAFASKASDARKSDGTNNYYKDVINNNSKWIYWMDHPVDVGAGDDWGTPLEGADFAPLNAPLVATLSGGADDFAPTEGNVQNGYDLFNNAETYDISLVVAGKASATTAAYIINNVAETRKDCVVFASPQNVSTGEPIIGSSNDLADDLIAYRALLPSTSYAVLDSGYKYQYDRYNDKYRWVPLNGDVAGLCARTDYTDDPWYSPGGYTRGQIKNVVKLAFNPKQLARDNMYKKGINPVVSFPGQGTLLYGDKTLLAKPSAFDRINVRRLFIVLEKAISTAAKYQLFEFNDQFTRAQFKSMVEPFLRDVQGRRGVTDFRVVCDETNNTGEVIDGNRFVADIFIKPARSINFITLNFIAARTSVSFEEIGG
jgi:hypothetical protein